MTSRSSFRDTPALMALVLIVLVFLWKGATMRGVFFGADEVGSDLIHYSYPYREYYATEYLQKGKLPLWNPYIASGIPFIAQAETGVFFPLTVVLYYFLPPQIAFNWLIISCFLLIAIGTYMYARIVGINEIGSFFSAIIFTLSGFMVGHLRHVPILSSVAFMPILFLLTERMLKSFQKAKRFSFWQVKLSLVLGIFMGFSIFGGHMTTVYMVFLILVIYFFFRMYTLYGFGWKNLPIILLFFSSFLVAGLLTAVQLFPTLEMVPYSTRAAINFQAAAVEIPYKLKYVLLFFLPYVFGDPSGGHWALGTSENFWENIGYIGILPFTIGIVTFIHGWIKKYSYIYVLVFLFSLCFLLVLGHNIFVYKFFWDFIPGFSILRISGRFLLYVDFFLAIGAGWGLMHGVKYIGGQAAYGIASSIILLSLLDLFLFGYGFNTVMPLSYFSQIPKSVTFLKRDTTIFKIACISGGKEWHKAWIDERGWRGDLSSYIAQKEFIPQDLQLQYHLSSSLPLNASKEHFGISRADSLDFLMFVDNITRSNQKKTKVLGMENVKYVLLDTRDNNREPELHLIQEVPTGGNNGMVYIYENAKWLPRAYMVGTSFYAKSDKAIVNRIISDSFDPATEVILEKDLKKPETHPNGSVTIRSYHDSHVVIDAIAKESGYLFLSDTYYPGWKAFVDGQETQIYRANYAYRAIYLTKGKHTVVFDYQPLSLQVGKIVSIISFAIVLLILLVPLSTWENRRSIQLL